MEALEEQQEAENGRNAEAGGKEPAGLPQRIHQKDTDEYRDGSRERDGVVRTQADQTGHFELTQHEADQTECTVQGDEAPQATDLAPADEVALGLGAPQQQQGVPHAVGGGGNGHGQKVSAFQVAGGQTVGVPGGDEGGAGEPAPNGHVGAGEQQQTRPSDKDKAIALQPVIEDVEPSSLSLRASHCYGHVKSSLYDIQCILG